MAKEMEELAQELKNTVETVKGYAEEVKGRMEKGEKLTDGLKEQTDEVLLKMNDMTARLEDLEQKAARRGVEPEAPVSIGEQLTKSDSFERYKSDPRTGTAARVSIKADITSATTDAAGSVGNLVQPQRLDGILELPRQRLTVRDLISAGRTNSNAITYIKQKGFTNNAATVAEGAKKPQSDLQYEEVTTGVKVIAHFMKASRQILDDAPMLQSQINNLLAYGLKLVEEKQLLNGDGSGSNLKGIIPQATAFSDPATMANYTIIDQLRLAMLQATIAEYPSTGHVLHPIDWTKIELLKDNDGRHIIGNPQGSATPTMWGLPVVVTSAIQSGKFLTGAFKMAAQLFDRWDLSVAVATQNEDDFVKNMVTILCEERLALAVYRPEAFIYGDLAAK
ncbi:phage major capsid protein [Suttonella ornithocola]|uniref:Predicted phage phi-C31 gp36 major capsid-like protein n=1 Tax=Suttonella ornithocola TaxID=279832 RepID=A0A380MSU7_9GAMM|nr:phage major capsid protein [Suttonella ornithocola]SUO95254.1 Predicted phage phi-C31 gp36 major capsid-like protein [Suttonella ornithocola]